MMLIYEYNTNLLIFESANGDWQISIFVDSDEISRLALFTTLLFSIILQKVF